MQVIILVNICSMVISMVRVYTPCTCTCTCTVLYMYITQSTSHIHTSPDILLTRLLLGCNMVVTPQSQPCNNIVNHIISDTTVHISLYIFHLWQHAHVPHVLIIIMYMYMYDSCVVMQLFQILGTWLRGTQN